MEKPRSIENIMCITIKDGQVASDDKTMVAIQQSGNTVNKESNLVRSEMFQACGLHYASEWTTDVYIDCSK